uniref:Uncharacterized protein n=1 Tax=Glossina brevipalpis TaxID=37001 RepID=A0A1A9WN50_9MUSC
MSSKCWCCKSRYFIQERTHNYIALRTSKEDVYGCVCPSVPKPSVNIASGILGHYGPFHLVHGPLLRHNNLPAVHDIYYGPHSPAAEIIRTLAENRSKYFSYNLFSYVFSDLAFLIIEKAIRLTAKHEV